MSGPETADDHPFGSTATPAGGRPRPADAPRRPVALVAGPQPSPDDDTQRLLRRRLRAGSTVLLVCYGLFVLRECLPFFDPPGPHGHWRLWVLLAAFLVQLVLTAMLQSRMTIDLGPLRWGELAALGCGALMLGVLQFSAEGSEVGAVPAGEREVLGALVGRFRVLPWFGLIVAYGMFIPNSSRRCLAVTVALAAAALAVAAASEARPGTGLPRWPHALAEMSTWLGIGCALAVYGSHRLGRLRHEVLEARKFGQYRLGRKLGGGGMGEVFLAEHELLRRPCALKLIRADRAGDEALRARFEREVKLTARLTHWNTVEIFDYGYTADGTFYYVMEYLQGLNLQELVQRFGPLPPGRVVYFLRQMCAALAEAHSRGLVHRDIKPNNAIVCRRGLVDDVVKLIDFGLVHDANGTGMTRVGEPLGTPLYMSPEQCSGATLDCRSDIYNLGLVAGFLLSGNHVAAGRAWYQMQWGGPLTRPAHAPDDLWQVVSRCLELDAANRYATVAELDEALAGCSCGADWSVERAAAWWRELPAIPEQPPSAQPSSDRTTTFS